MLAIVDEKARDEPDIGLITETIARDVGISAALLKMANSLLFGLKQNVRSVQQAVGLLGLSRGVTLANSLACVLFSASDDGTIKNLIAVSQLAGQLSNLQLPQDRSKRVPCRCLIRCREVL